jgi:hypothetical protein
VAGRVEKFKSSGVQEGKGLTQRAQRKRGEFAEKRREEKRRTE